MREVAAADPRLVVVDSFTTVVHAVANDRGGEADLQRVVQPLGVLLTGCEATTFLVGEYARADAEERRLVDRAAGTGRGKEPLNTSDDLTTGIGPARTGSTAGEATERLMEQIREANERLVLTSIDAQASTEAAESENRFKEEFLGTLSHELRTPLHAVFGWARLLEDRRLDASQSRRAIEAIGRNARAMAHIVDELLDVARISAGKIHLAMEPMDAAAAIRAAVDAVASAAAVKGVELSFSSRLAGERVNADSVRLQQVLWNLLTNAIKFTPASGRVDVAVTRVDHQVEITVSDTGGGIAVELLPHVFERYRQGDRRAGGACQGLGLGLAIAQHLVELHGGTLRARSAGEGRGSTFTMRLPVLAVEPAMRTAGGRRDERRGGCGRPERGERAAGRIP